MKTRLEILPYRNFQKSISNSRANSVQIQDSYHLHMLEHNCKCICVRCSARDGAVFEGSTLLSVLELYVVDIFS